MLIYFQKSNFVQSQANQKGRLFLLNRVNLKLVFTKGLLEKQVTNYN